MKNKVSIAVLTMIFAIMPVVALANGHDQGITELIKNVETWVSALLPIMLSLGVLAFFYGLAMYLFKLGGEDTSKGKEIMIYGILAIFVMASIGGIVSMLQGVTNTESSVELTSPCIIEGQC